MAWTIEYGPSALRDLKHLPRGFATRVVEFIEDELETADDPCLLGRQLKGYSHTWRFRVGEHRIVAKANNREKLFVIWVVDHRRSVYQAARRRLKAG